MDAIGSKFLSYDIKGSPIFLTVCWSTMWSYRDRQDRSLVLQVSYHLINKSWIQLMWLESLDSDVCVCVCVFSRVWLFVTPWTVARQAPRSMGFPRQEHWSGLPFPPSEDLPNSGTEPESPALAGEFFAAEPPGKPLILISTSISQMQAFIWRTLWV